MYFSLESIPILALQKKVDENMIETFKRTYECAQCLIDCTEHFC